MGLLLKCALSLAILLNIVHGQLHAQTKIFPLQSVRLDDGPFLHAQKVNRGYILSLDEDRLLYPFYREAGIAPPAESYGNWESSGLDGHTAGHYLSALALLYASTHDEEVKKRLDKMVNELGRCQAKNSRGYVGGIPGGYAMWEDIRAGKINADNFSLNGKWVPLYNIHKLYMGLYDAHVIANNKAAGEIFFKLCDWFMGVIAGLSDDQIQTMLRSEHGGMNEIFALASELSGKKEYAAVAEKLSHQKILSPLLQNRDSLTGLHANTQIPKVIGFKKVADLTGNESWLSAADFFWRTMVKDRTVSIGGNSVREHFHPTQDFSTMISSNQGPETCNTYNMLRLTKSLFLTKPEAAYIDFYERAMFNHILSSQHPEHGGLVYFTPMRPGHYRVYSNPQKSFWCCVGSGIENHSKYGELVYAHSADAFYVNLFVASTVTWKEKGVVITQKTKFPKTAESTLRISAKKPSHFTLKIRKPVWVQQDEFRLSLNGRPIRPEIGDDGYSSISRDWKEGDIIKIETPMEIQMEKLPDGSSWGSFMYGPIVLAAATDTTNLVGLVADDSRMGHVAEGRYHPIDEAPAIVKKDDNFLDQVKPVQGKELTFTAGSLIYPSTYAGLRLVPFSSIHDSRYIIYWPITTPSGLQEMNARMKAREAEERLLKERTLDEVMAGEQQPEVEHGFKGDSTHTGLTEGKWWRTAEGSFSYKLTGGSSDAHTLRVIYTTGGQKRDFSVLLNGQLLKAEKFKDSWAEGTFTVDYPISKLLLSSANGSYEVKFEATSGSNTGRIISVHLLTK